MREREIRTPDYNLLFCKAIITDEGRIFLEHKNGKRMEQIPIEVFLTEINGLIQGCSLKLHIEMK